jgi:hypothetical protein
MYAISLHLLLHAFAATLMWWELNFNIHEPTHGQICLEWLTAQEANLAKEDTSVSKLPRQIAWRDSLEKVAFEMLVYIVLL